VVRHALRAAVRFAFAWYNTIIPEIEEYCLGNQSGGWKKVAEVWLSPFFNMPKIPQRGNLSNVTNPSVDTSDAAVITKWCENFAGWLDNLHESEAENIKLFFMDRVTSPEEMYFGRLVQDDPRSGSEQDRDTVDSIKLKLDARETDGIDPDQIEARGYVGLAKYMYIICGL